MTETSSAKVVAGCLGLAAFAIALIAGLGSGAEADVVLGRAVISMFVCFLVGYAVGLAGERAIDEAAQRFRNEHPIEELPSDNDAEHEHYHATDSERGAVMETAS